MAQSQNEKQLNKHINLYTLHQFLNWGNVGLTLVILVLLLEDRGFNLFEISSLFAIYSAATFLLELPLGALSDQIGRKKTYLSAVIVNILSTVILLFASHFFVAVLSFIAMGLARALMSGSLDAWFYDELKKIDDEVEDQPILAKVQMFAGLGLAIFAVIGGFIADFFADLMAFQGYSQYDATLIASIIFGFVLITYTQIFIIEAWTPKDSDNSKWQEFKLILSEASQYAFKHQMVSSLLLSSALFALSLFTLETFWFLYVKPMIQSDLQTTYIGALTFLYFFAMAMGANFSKYFVALASGRYARALIFISVAIAISFAILGYHQNLYLFAINLAILCLFIGASSSPFLSLYQSQIPSDRRSTLLSLQSFGDKVGGLIGMFVLGYIAEQTSITMAWISASIVILLAALNYWRIDLKLLQDTPKSD